MRLWNAHRRVLYKRPLSPEAIRRLQGDENGWRKLLNEDVVKFIDNLDVENLAGSAKEREDRIKLITRDPASYFSRPKNVPLQLRKQVYLPDILVALVRTPQLPPKYASFWVPLWFNKLDFKNYLKNVYNVDVLHVRSYVQQQKVEREDFQKGAHTFLGPLFRPEARKKMTVELVDPFVYPEAEKDLSPWEAESFKREKKAHEEMSRTAFQPYREEADTKGRRSLGKQAQDLLLGKQKWKPSWQSISADAKIMQDTSRPPGIRGTV